MNQNPQSKYQKQTVYKNTNDCRLQRVRTDMQRNLVIVPPIINRKYLHDTSNPQDPLYFSRMHPFRLNLPYIVKPNTCHAYKQDAVTNRRFPFSAYLQKIGRKTLQIESTLHEHKSSIYYANIFCCNRLSFHIHTLLF